MNNLMNNSNDYSFVINDKSDSELTNGIYLITKLTNF